MPPSDSIAFALGGVASTEMLATMGYVGTRKVTLWQRITWRECSGL